MCVARIAEMSQDLWAVSAVLCHGNPARNTIVSAPRHGQAEAMEAARALLLNTSCGTITEEVVHKPTKPNVFGIT